MDEMLKYQHTSLENEITVKYMVFDDPDNIWRMADYLHAGQVLVHHSRKSDRTAVKFIVEEA